MHTETCKSVSYDYAKNTVMFVDFGKFFLLLIN